MLKSSDIKRQFLGQLRELQDLHLPPYLIWGSGPLAIRGLRKSHDIDLLVSKQAWNQLIKSYPPATEKMIRIRKIEIWNDCLNLTDRIDEMIAHADWIEGFPFMTLSDTIAWKNFLHREKDLKDIALIEDL